MFEAILSKEKQIAIIGLGYVGLPIALAFAKKVRVIGFDINEDRIKLMNNGIDPSNELESSDFENSDIRFTADPEDLKQASFFIIAVPTPVDRHNVPDLVPILSASATVGFALSTGDVVVYESTVYPGCTEEDCVPVLEASSRLEYKKDFKVGYSPERINPGDREHTLAKIVKVASGCDQESGELIKKVYELVVDAGVHLAPGIKVAEAAKIIENTQRDVNIALMNELSKIFDRVGINTYDVLAAARTKWNFLPFFPGLVGGHCIGVDPYYLTYKAAELGYDSEVILAGRRINDDMPGYVAKKTIQKIVNLEKNIKGARILILGATFKENVSDIRNSKVFELVSELKSFSTDVDIHDPYADPAEVQKEYGVSLSPIRDHYDAIILAVNHDEYLKFTEKDFLKISNERTVFIDIKGIYKDKIHKMDYWSL